MDNIAIKQTKTKTAKGLSVRFKSALFVFAAAIFTFLFCACDPSAAADKSNNIRVVNAHYFINNDIETSDRLAKTAVLSYRYIDIIPKDSIKLNSVSFDLKLKDGDEGQEIAVDVYCIEDSSAGIDSLEPVLSQNITLTEEFKNHSFNLPSQFSISVDNTQKVHVGGSIRVVFTKNDGSENRDIMFSINNVTLK